MCSAIIGPISTNDIIVFWPFFFFRNKLSVTMTRMTKEMYQNEKGMRGASIAACR